MKKFIPLFILIINTFLYSQYQVKSPYLSNPDLAKGYVDSCASFWQKSYDAVKGGFYTNVMRDGSIRNKNEKNMITQTRHAYGLTRAFMLTGNETYLNMAKLALTFMYNHAWDNVNEGWYDRMTDDGSVYPSDAKTAFNQHYALLGILTHYEATSDTSDYTWLQKGYQSNEVHLWDSRGAAFGYYDNSSANWSSTQQKSFNATVDAITTHLLYLFLMTGEQKYKDRLLQMADNIINHLTASMDNYKIGFVESYDSDWGWNDNSSNYNTRTIMGHVLKSGWVLGRIYQLVPDVKYLTAAQKLVDNVLSKGYDHKYGGPYKDYDRVSGSMLFYGQDTAKAWWQMEQAITGGLVLYDITNDNKYLTMADESLNFFMKYFVDHTYGEVYSDLFKNGNIIPAWGTDKGNSSKAGYHSMETGYYTYLYGKLYYKKEPVTLYYYFTPADKQREVLLTPLAIQSSRLKIKEVSQNSVKYLNYDALLRKLILPAGTAGKFSVTYELTAPTAVHQSAALIPNSYKLNQNYPNPFNPTTQISYQLAAAGYVTLKVFDLLGREVAALVNEQKNAGSYEVTFNGANLSSGVYLYQLRSGSFVETKKLIFMK